MKLRHIFLLYAGVDFVHLKTQYVIIFLSRIGGKSTNVQVDSTNSEGYTALHYACWQGHENVAQLLKNAEADPRARY